MTKKRKIAFYIESMVVGGAEKVLIDLVNNLDKEKFDITVIAIFKKSVYSEYEFQFETSFSPHVRYVYLVDNTNKLAYRAFQIAFNRLPKSWIYRFLVKEQYDVEIAFYEGLPTEFVASSNQKSKKIAWLHTHQQRLYEHLNPQEIAVSKSKYNKFHEIVGVSKAVVASFEAIMGKMPTQCIYNFLDKENIIKQSNESVSVPFNGPYWVTVGRLIPIKGYDRLIRVLGRLKQEGYNFSLLMLGDGSERGALEQLVEDLDLSNEVCFLGNTSNPYPYMKQAELFICSSHQEGLSTVVMESLVLNTPVVTTNCSGMDELIKNNVTGIIISNNEIGILEGIKNLFDNVNLLASMKNNLKTINTALKINDSIEAIKLLLK